jgi:hypothetical protein
MDRKIVYSLLFIVLITALHCKNRHTAPPSTANAVTVKQGQLSIKQVGKLRFRRSYAGHEQLTDREVEKMRKARPTLYNNFDKDLRDKMESYGFINENELLLTKFKYDTAAVVEIKDQAGHIIKARFQNDPADFARYTLIVTQSTRIAAIRISDYVQELKYRLLDIITGGYPEIVLLNEYYIMNGDNFDLLVFEIRT